MLTDDAEWDFVAAADAQAADEQLLGDLPPSAALPPPDDPRGCSADRAGQQPAQCLADAALPPPPTGYLDHPQHDCDWLDHAADEQALSVEEQQCPWLEAPPNFEEAPVGEVAGDRGTADPPAQRPVGMLGGGTAYPPDFAAASTFEGAHPGCVFKCGPRGFGFYRDVQPSLGSHIPPGPPAQSMQPQERMVLNLAELVMPPAADAANSLTQAWWMDDAELAALVSPPSRPARHRRAAGRRLRQRPRRPHFGPRQDLQPVTVLADATWRQHGLWAIDTFNPNAWASAKDVMLHSPADILALQEVRVHDEEQCRRLEQAARPCGWTASIAPASRTAAGSSSAGVAILARRGIGMADHGAESLPCTHRDRLSVNWIGGVRRGGMHVISIYLWTSEGLSERNSSLLHHLSLLIGSLRGPWIVAGDWNVEPTVLQQAGWPAKLRGQLFAPTLPTCGLRCYDFCLVDVAIAHMVVGVQAISDAGGRPHRVSRLLLDGALQRGQVRQMVKPRAIIADLPPTAPRRPPDLRSAGY